MSDPLMPPEAELVVEQARLLRLAYGLGEKPEELPLALALERRNAMLSRLKNQKDPADGEKLSLGFCWASFEPDERGLLEVLVTTTGQRPLTIYVKGTEVVYVVEGW